MHYDFSDSGSTRSEVGRRSAQFISLPSSHSMCHYIRNTALKEKYHNTSHTYPDNGDNRSPKHWVLF